MLDTETKKLISIGPDGHEYIDVDVRENIHDIETRLTEDVQILGELWGNLVLRHLPVELIIRASQAAQPSGSDDRGTTGTATAGERTGTGSNATVT
jgi:hypothetical protein